MLDRNVTLEVVGQQYDRPIIYHLSLSGLKLLFNRDEVLDPDECVIKNTDFVCHAIFLPNSEGCIFSDGTLTNGEKFCSKSIREWMQSFKYNTAFVDI